MYLYWELNICTKCSIVNKNCKQLNRWYTKRDKSTLFKGFSLEAQLRTEGGFLLTGVIVHQTCRVIGYAGLLAGSTGTIIAGGAGGPAGILAAASAVIMAAPEAAAAVEAGSLAIGTAASWIPWLP